MLIADLERCLEEKNILFRKLIFGFVVLQLVKEFDELIAWKRTET